MISIDKITVSYDKKNPVLNNLSLNMEENKIHGIVGLNGAGKSTLLNTLYGLKKAVSGKILIHQQKLTKKDISFLVTENFFYSGITAREYLSLFKAPDYDIDQWNTLFTLPLDNIVDRFSSGMKKKLALMGVLKQNKPIIILDEPFNGLDIESCRMVRSILLALMGKGKTIIITSHIIETLTNLCDQIHYLEGGVIKFSRTKDQFEEFQRTIFNDIENRNEKIIRDLI